MDAQQPRPSSMLPPVRSSGRAPVDSTFADMAVPLDGVGHSIAPTAVERRATCAAARSGAVQLQYQMADLQAQVQALIDAGKAERESGLDESRLKAWSQTVGQWPISLLEKPFDNNLPLDSKPAVAGPRVDLDSYIVAKESTPDTDTILLEHVGKESAVSHMTVGLARLDSAGRTNGARPDIDRLAVSWGATEGGRDRLNWIRHLVRYTELHPIYVPDSRSPDLQLVPTQTDGRGVRKVVFPSLRPNRREDVLLLKQWLSEMLSQLGDNLPKPQTGGVVQKQASDDLVSAALWVYGVAFDELRRQIATESRDRAELLAATWDHFFTLVELRAAAQYESRLSDAQHLFEALRRRIAEAEHKSQTLVQRVQAAEEQHAATHFQKEAQLRAIAHRTVKAESAKVGDAREKQVLEDVLRREVERRLSAEEKLVAAEAELFKLRKEQSKVVEKLHMATQMTVAMTDQLTQVQAEASEKSVAVDTITADFDGLNASLLEQQSRCEALKRELGVQELLSRSLQEQAREQQLTASVLEQRLAAAEDTLAARNVAQMELLEGKAALQQQLQAAEAQHADLQAHIEGVLRELQDNRDAQASERQQLRDELASRDALLASAHEDLISAQNDCQALKDDLTQAESKVSNGDQALQQATQELNVCRARARKLNSELMYLGCVKAQALTDTDSAWDCLGPDGNLQEVLAICPDFLDELRQRAMEAERTSAVQQEQLKHAAATRKLLEDELQELRNERARAVREREEAEIAAASAGDDLQSARAEVAELAERTRELEEAEAALRGTVDEQTAQLIRLMRCEEQAQALHAQLQEHQAQLDAAQGQLRDKELSAEALQSQLAAMAQEHEDAQRLTQDMRSIVQDQGAQITELLVISAMKDRLEADHHNLTQQHCSLLRSHKKVVDKLMVTKMFLKNHVETAVETALKDGGMRGTAAVSDGPLPCHASAVGPGETSKAADNDAGGSGEAQQVAALFKLKADRRHQAEALAEALRREAALKARLEEMAAVPSSDAAAAVPALMAHLKEEVQSLEARCAHLQQELDASLLREHEQAVRAQAVPADLVEEYRAMHSHVGAAAWQLASSRAGSFKSWTPPLAGAAPTSTAPPTLRSASSTLRDEVPPALPQELAAAAHQPSALRLAQTYVEVAPDKSSLLAEPIADAMGGVVGPATGSVQMPRGIGVLDHRSQQLGSRSSRFEQALSSEDTTARNSSAQLAAPMAMQGGSDAVMERFDSEQPLLLGNIASEAPGDYAVREQIAAHRDARELGNSFEGAARATALHGGETMEALIAEMDGDITMRANSSLRLRVALLGWFCKNMRQRCADEIAARMIAEGKLLELEAQTVQSASQRERQLCEALPAVFASGKECLQHAVAGLARLRTELDELQELRDAVDRQVSMLGAALAEVTARLSSKEVDVDEKGVQANDSRLEAWLGFVRALPSDPADTTLMSHAALSNTITLLYQLRVSQLDASVGAEQLLRSDTVFDVMTDYFNRQLAGDEETVHNPDLESSDGPIARLVMSCRLYMDDPKVRLFASFTGVLDEHLGADAWQFVLSVIYCLRKLMMDNWQLLLKAWPTARGAPVPLQAAMDVFGNLYNSDDPSALPVTTHKLMPLLKDSRIGQAVDFDILLMTLVQEFTEHQCPRNPACFPRRISNGMALNATHLSGAVSPSRGTPMGRSTAGYTTPAANPSTPGSVRPTSTI